MNLLFIALLIFTGVVSAEQHMLSLPPEIASFVEGRDLCDHFRGEEPYDAERRAFLEKNMIDLCTGTDRQLAELKLKYSDDPDVMSVLNQYESNIEPHTEQ